MCSCVFSAGGDGEEREPADPAPLDEAGHLRGARHAQGLLLRGRGEEEHGPLREQEGLQGLHQPGLCTAGVLFTNCTVSMRPHSHRQSHSPSDSDFGEDYSGSAYSFSSQHLEAVDDEESNNASYL